MRKHPLGSAVNAKKGAYVLNHPPARSLLFSVLLIGLAVSSSAVFAALGGPPLAQSPLAAPAVKELKSVSAGTTPDYTTQVVELNTGTIVREFVSASGVVFAVIWSGPVMPDFGTVLGSSITVFNSEASLARTSGRRGGTLGVHAQGLVVVSAGHMRSYHGYAYLESLVPAGIDVLSLVE